MSCDRELSECAKIVHYVHVGLISLFLGKKKSQKPFRLIFNLFCHSKKNIDCDFFSAPSTFLWSEHRKSFDPGASIVSRIKDLDLTLN